MKKTMYQITVYRDGDDICIKGPDSEFGVQEICFTVDQAQIVINWIGEAMREQMDRLYPYSETEKK